jgi:transcriptional regulator with XRE-family HTH domain
MSPTDGYDFSLYRSDLGKELRRIRKLQGVSVERLAESTGLHENTIGCIERGRNDIKLVSNARIMAALGCESFDIGETTFSFTVEALADYPERGSVLGLHASSIVYMTGRTIRERRIAEGVTILRLSERTGIHYNTIWNIENGLVEATLFNLYRIHKSLSVLSLKGTAKGLQIVG